MNAEHKFVTLNREVDDVSFFKDVPNNFQCSAIYYHLV